MSPPKEPKAEVTSVGEPSSGPARARGTRRFEQLLALLEEAYHEDIADLELEVRRLQGGGQAGLPTRFMDDFEAVESQVHENEEPPVRSSAVIASVSATMTSAPNRQAELAQGDDRPPAPQPQPRADGTMALVDNQPLSDRRPLGPLEPPQDAHRRAQPSVEGGARDAKGKVPRSLTAFHSEERRVTTSGSGCLRAVVESDTFDIVFCSIILLSAIFFAVELELTGQGQGASLSVYTVSPPSWDYGKFFHVVQWVFSIIFAVELLLKLGGIRLDFFREPWNWVDVAIVVTTLLSLSLTDTLPFDPKPLRIVRLARLMRLMHRVKSIKAFDSLYLMVTAMKQCFHILTWTCALGIVLQLMLSLLVTEFLYGFYFCEAISDEGGSNKACGHLPEGEVARQKEVYLYYGTFVRSMFTMFELMLANWPPAARVLSENVHWSFMFICIMHKLVFGFACVAVVVGVITRETFTVAELDDHIMLFQKERQMEAHAEKMKALFKGADTSNDGTITLPEFRSIMKNNEVRIWLASMGMNAGDVDQLFALIDSSGDGEITTDELIKGVSRLKGFARSLDLIALMEAHSHLYERLNEYFEGLSEKKVIAIEGDEVVARRGNEWANAVVTHASNRIVMLRWTVDGVEDSVPTADVRVKCEPSAGQHIRQQGSASSSQSAQLSIEDAVFQS